MTFSPLEKTLRRHVKTYQEYNASNCAELFSTPSSLEFHRFVAANRPVVIRGQGYREQIGALERWSDDYLLRKMEEKLVDISVDPTGNADSIVDGYFVEPATVKMPFSNLLSNLQEEQDTTNPTSPVFYLQSQNGNLADEYAPLLEDVGTEGPAWARDAFGQPPDVANIWIGGSRSKTSMHKDPYENIYLVVRGSKEFILLPPSETYCLHEQTYPHASWSYSPDRHDDPFKLVPTTPTMTLPWIPIDPSIPLSDQDSIRFPRYALSRPMRVTLHPGDMLYLPALWFHHVSQTPDYFHRGDEPTTGVKATIAVNWWTDMKYEGSFWSTIELNRRLVELLDADSHEGDDQDHDDEDDE
ncbi:cupin-like domain-containing protein [Sporobolomyces koalae]|uniref:cupin-like domain-containing protein n=1 Tax=Sporobolomyces koalae TaxID=500713 RepID=UPI00316CF8CA